jgi:hypothetical protein
MNWYSPRADEVETCLRIEIGFHLRGGQQIFEAGAGSVGGLLIAPAIRTREGSTPVVAVAFEMSTDICWCPRLAKRPPRSYRHYPAAIMVNGGLTRNPRLRPPFPDAQLHIVDTPLGEGGKSILPIVVMVFGLARFIRAAD